MFLCIMDDDTNEMVTTIIPALTRCQKTRNRVPLSTAANFICDDSAIPRSLPRHSPYKLERED